ncbi:MAG: 3-dehydroquinate synthase [Kiritimatiellaeota bacterium]|nr:3-dehydroquinate synthase [Kiritimatiellota bacterium]
MLAAEGALALPAVRRELRERLADRDCFVITDDTVGPLYLAPLVRVVKEVGARSCATTAFPAGEASKTLATLGDLCRRAVENGLDRQALFIALGGGVVGDLTGFAAATYMRGVAYIQVPTTLLAMVDSSVGGKTAVDLPEGKNLVGAFHQPELVLAQLNWLRTLPPRQVRCGVAEVIKYGVILDPEFFAYLEASMPELLVLDATVCRQVVLQSCRLKAQVVAQDENESKGIREILNFGHTFGHAVEALGGYSTVTHGEAVAVGMLMAAGLSERLGLAPEGTAARLEALIRAAGLPVRAQPPGATPDAILEGMSRDKKVKHGQLRLVLVRDIGVAQVVECNDRELLLEVIGRYCGQP